MTHLDPTGPRTDGALQVLVPVGASALAGSQLSLLRLIAAVPADRVRFHLWVFEDGPLLETLEQRGVSFDRLPRSWLRTPWGAARLLAALRSRRPDLIYLHASRLLALLARRAGIPCLERVNMPRARGAGGWCRYRWLDRWASNLNTGLLPVSAALAQQLAGRGVAPAKLCVFRDLIHPEQFRRPELRAPVRAELGVAEDEILVLSIGRLVEQKGPDLFADVARHLRSNGEGRFRFCWLGDGPLAPVLGNRGPRTHPDERTNQCPVLHLPFRKDVAGVLAAADIFLQTSRWEGLANTLLEAMAAGLPIVATEVDGTAEALTVYPPGKLTPSDDADAAAAALREIVRQFPESRPPARAATTDVPRFPAMFTAPSVAGHFVALVAAAAAGRPLPEADAVEKPFTEKNAVSAGRPEPRSSRHRASASTPVVVLANDPFDSQWRRKQQLYSRLARRRPVVWVDPPFSVLDFARGRRELASHLRTPIRIRSPREGLTILSGSPGLPGETYAGTLTIANAWLHRHWCRRALRHLDAQRPGSASRAILVCYWPLFHPLPGLPPELRPRKLVYDAIDDYAALTPFSGLRRRIDRAADLLAAATDLTLVTNRRLADRLAAAARRIEILPHGVDTALFHPGAAEGSRFEAIAAEPGLKVVFHGTLDHRLDQAVLIKILEDGITLLLAGQVGWRRGELARLEAAGDCRYAGELTQADAAALVAAGDVGIIPYRRLPGMDRVQTLKRLEFFASGLPVVATDMAPYRDHAGELILAGDPASFSQAVRRAETLSPLSRDARIALAEENTWEARVNALDGHLMD